MEKEKTLNLEQCKKILELVQLINIETAKSSELIGNSLKKLDHILKTKGEKMKEQKYFISYVAYLKSNNENTKLSYDFFNGIMHISEPITSDLLVQIENSLIEKLNKDTETNPYTVAQIINITKI